MSPICFSSRYASALVDGSESLGPGLATFSQTICTCFSLRPIGARRASRTRATLTLGGVLARRQVGAVRVETARETFVGTRAELVERDATGRDGGAVVAWRRRRALAGDESRYACDSHDAEPASALHT